MNNKLIKTDGIFYKIKNIFRKLFHSSDISSEKVELITQKADAEIQENTFGAEYKKEIQENNRKKLLAQKLKTGELDSYDLTDSEVDEMIEYFDKDIMQKNKELERIKTHILEMQNELNKQN